VPVLGRILGAEFRGGILAKASGVRHVVRVGLGAVAVVEHLPVDRFFHTLGSVKAVVVATAARFAGNFAKGAVPFVGAGAVLVGGGSIPNEQLIWIIGWLSRLAGSAVQAVHRTTSRGGSS